MTDSRLIIEAADMIMNEDINGKIKNIAISPIRLILKLGSMLLNMFKISENLYKTFIEIFLTKSHR